MFCTLTGDVAAKFILVAKWRSESAKCRCILLPNRFLTSVTDPQFANEILKSQHVVAKIEISVEEFKAYCLQGLFSSKLHPLVAFEDHAASQKHLWLHCCHCRTFKLHLQNDAKTNMERTTLPLPGPTSQRTSTNLFPGNASNFPIHKAPSDPARGSPCSWFGRNTWVLRDLEGTML